MIWLIVIIWFALGLAGSGFIYAMMRHDYPDSSTKKQDAGQSILLSWAGPISLVILYLMSGFGEHGWWIWGGDK
jgi:hypothetical protein